MIPSYDLSYGEKLLITAIDHPIAKLTHSPRASWLWKTSEEYKG